MLRPTNHLIPEQTSRIAKQAFPNGNLLINMRDVLGLIFKDEAFEDLYPSHGQPAWSPTQLALVTLMQFIENLTDRQAAEAVRARIDWKYVLGLELTDAGFDYSVLSEFRQRLISGGKEQMLFDELLKVCQEKGYVGGQKQQRTDSTHIVAAIRALSRLELVIETMRRALDDLAQEAPEWLKQQIQPGWEQRYTRQIDSYHLPKRMEQREDLAEQVGKDGAHLIEAIFREMAPANLRELPSIKILCRIWVQQYYQEEGGIHWRSKEKWGQPPAGQMISSPDDLDAHYCVKRSTEWTGYKVHLTETCAEGYPHLITQVTSTTATVHDVKLTRSIQDQLIGKGLKPDQQFVDSGYLESDLLFDSLQKGIDLVGPMPSDNTWQAHQPGAFEHTSFEIDWHQMRATCPAGKISSSGRQGHTRRGTPNYQFVFQLTDCLPCSFRVRCTRSSSVGRFLTIYPAQQYATLVQARLRQKSETFKKLYGLRAGIEGTISEAVRCFGLRKARYRSLAKVRLQHLVTAAAINVLRVIQWLEGFRPVSDRITPFAAFLAQV
jgi:transposase